MYNVSDDKNPVVISPEAVLGGVFKENIHTRAEFLNP